MFELKVKRIKDLVNLDRIVQGNTRYEKYIAEGFPSSYKTGSGGAHASLRDYEWVGRSSFHDTLFLLAHLLLWKLTSLNWLSNIFVAAPAFVLLITATSSWPSQYSSFCSQVIFEAFALCTRVSRRVSLCTLGV